MSRHLMAKFRRFASPQFDWKESGNQEESRRTHSPGYPDKFLFDRWTAPLENGHWLEVRGLPNHNIGSGYAAVIHTGGSPHDGYPLHPADELLGEKDPDYERYHVGIPYHNINSLSAMYYDNPMEKLDNGDGSGGLRPLHQLIHNHPDRESAITAVEAAYQHMFPVGTDTGSHDSGVDYSDLNKFKDFL